MDDNAARFPLADFLGMTVTIIGTGRARAHLDSDERHLNPNGVVHGAVLFAMVDTAMGAALLSSLEDGAACATTDVHLRFLRPATRGRLETIVTVIHAGKTTATLEGTVLCDHQRVATATGAFAILGRDAGRHVSGQ